MNLTTIGKTLEVPQSDSCGHSGSVSLCKSYMNSSGNYHRLLKAKETKSPSISLTPAPQKSSNNMAQSTYCTRPYMAPATANIPTAHAGGKEGGEGRKEKCKEHYCIIYQHSLRPFSQRKTTQVPLVGIHRVTSLPSLAITQFNMSF